MQRRTFLRLGIAAASAALVAGDSVTVARRLLLATGGGSSGIPQPTPFVRSITSAPHGGWTVIAQPAAASYNGHTYVVYVNGSNGNVEIVDHDELAETTSSPFVLHSALDSPGDSHDCPSVLVRSSDHRIVVAYSAHGDTNPRVRISTNPADSSAFGSEIVPSITSDSITYCNLFELSGESNALYLFFRDFDHGPETAQWSYMKSTNGGATWSASTKVWAIAGESAYWHVGSNGVDRIDFAATDVAPQAISGSGASDVFHAYYQGGAWHQTDGTTITATLPFGTADVTKVCDGGTMGGGNFPYGISYTADGRPVIADALYLTGGTDNGYYDLRWSGSTWVVNEVLASAGGVFFSNQSGGVNVVASNASIYYASVLIAGQWEIVRYRTIDDGMSWSARQATFASSGVNIRPAQVRGTGAFEIVVLEGTYTSDTDFDLGVLGMGL